MGQSPNYWEPNSVDFNVEDLCVAVKLEVAVPKRPLSTSNGSTVISWQTVIDNANLFGGTDGYLSTSYSDISSLDPHNGGNKDSLGIEYINIQYNSWNFPEVDMKLVDIRGNAIMNPLESRQNNGRNTGSFLNALFTFPYPMFKLTVKGYYGKPVTYKLTVRDVRTNFNATNGNFEVTVKFIGYMFGYLNDIPMQYLLIAPDINYGGSAPSLGNFQDEDGKEIPTFRDFLKGVTSTIEVINGNGTIGELKNKSKRLGDMINVITELLDLVEAIYLDIKEGDTYAVSNNVLSITRSSDGKIYTFDKASDTSASENVDSDLNNAVRRLRTDVINVIKKHKKFITDFNQDSTGEIAGLNDLETENVKDGRLLKGGIADDVEVTITTPFELYYDYSTLKSDINSKRSALMLEKGEIDSNLNSLIGEAYTVTLGWKPSIGNIFNMVLAHFRCFYGTYYKCIQNIHSTSQQRNSSRVTIETDVKINGSHTIPPFPLLVNKSNQKYQWIGDVSEMKDTYEERSFVDAIVQGATNTAEALAREAMDFDTQRDYSLYPSKGIPTLLSDLYYDGNERVNPYKGTSYVLGEGETIPSALKTFAKRLLLKYCFNVRDYANVPITTFAEIEAYNCYKEHLSMDDSQHITSLDCWDPARTVDLMREYIANDFTNYSSSYKDNVSLFYEDFRGTDSISDGAGDNATLKYKDATFFEWDDQARLYGAEMNEIYSYIESYMGGIVSAYKKVFPKPDNIPIEVNGNAEKCKNVSVMPKEATNTFSSNIQSESTSYYSLGDAFFMYNHCDSTGKTYNINNKDILCQFALSLNTLPYTTDIHLDARGIFRIPTVVLVGLCKAIKLECYGFANKKESLGSIYTKLSSNFISSKSNEYERILKNIANSCQEYVEKDAENNDYYSDTTYYLTKLTPEASRQLTELVSETTTIYNLKGKLRDLGRDHNNAVYVDAKIDEVIKSDARKFASKLVELYGQMSETEHRIENERRNYASSDKKISIYMTMKELYDRWKFGTWRPIGGGAAHTDMMISHNNFVFLDSLYSDIKYKHFINFDTFAQLVRNIIDNANEMSVYSFLYEVCKLGNMTLQALPINIYEYLGGNTDAIQDMFTAYPYMSCDDTAMQTTYIAMYAHKPSEHLDIVDDFNAYADDGIDLSSSSTVLESEKPLPVFGVTYGLQKQRFFKNISVGSDNPKTTAHSLMSELLIAKQGTSGSENIGFEGHDIFDVYASKSYTCKVEMMGNAMIMPMMYFQLNNIPMFKGGYFIISAEHNISKNGMTTTFTGVRVNKNRFDLLPKTLNLQSITDAATGGGRGDVRENKIGNATIPTSSEFGSVRTYSKSDVTILLDAGHDMRTEGKESPIFDIHDINIITTKNSNHDVETFDVVEKVDTSNEGILKPLSITGQAVFTGNTGTNNEGRTRFREYWGNRKIVNEIKEQLISEGISEDRIKIISTTGRRAEPYDTVHGPNNYSKDVNKIYEETQGNCIMISIHSNALGSSNSFPVDYEDTNPNYWSIFCQNNDEWIRNDNKKRRDVSDPLPHITESYSLANWIYRSMRVMGGSEEWLNSFKKIDDDFGNGKVKVFTETDNGIRPLTFCKPPTVLSENFFFTSPDGVRIIGTKKGVELIAKAHVRGIMAFLGDSEAQRNSTFNSPFIS